MSIRPPSSVLRQLVSVLCSIPLESGRTPYGPEADPLTEPLASHPQVLPAPDGAMARPQALPASNGITGHFLHIR